MSGRGQAPSKPTGSKSTSRPHKTRRGNIQGIKKPVLRRLARRAGVMQVSDSAYEKARRALKMHLDTVLLGAIAHARHAGRRTIGAKDVAYAQMHR